MKKLTNKTAHTIKGGAKRFVIEDIVVMPKSSFVIDDIVVMP